MSGWPCAPRLDENLAMIRDTVSHLRAEGQRVFLDAEHFFDGYRSDPAYALEVVRTAAEAGADVVALCDTNGGMLPGELGDVVGRGRRGHRRAAGHPLPRRHRLRGGQHAWSAVDAGVTHVQGTANGYGERAGNANLFSVVAGLQLKKGREVLPDGLPGRDEPGRARDQRGHQRDPGHAPAVCRVSPRSRTRRACTPPRSRWTRCSTSTSIPALVGNDMRMLVSDMAGRASVEIKGKQLGYDLSGDKATVGRVVERVKELEARGYTFEAADASFELLLRDELAGERLRHFDVESWRVIVERRAGRRGGQRGHRQAARPRASGSSPPARATGRSTRSTTRCGWRWSGSTRNWPGWSWPTTRSASWRARTAPAR